MRIAFVEDDKQLRKSVSRGLREAGYTVDEAGTGDQALTLVEAHSYDAVVIDILIPAPDGIEVCRRIRAGKRRMPILMLTALDAVDQRIRGLDSGADDYLTKPFDFRELLARLRALTRRSAEPAPARVTVGDVVIDPARREVKRDGKTITLTAREYEFLLFLARNTSRVVTRQEILREVWGDAGISYSNVLDVYASRLRKKLDDDERAPMLTTVRGSGFLFATPSSGATKQAETRVAPKRRA